MTALQTPAPDAPVEEWGAFAESIPGWRWMPGMRAIDSTGEDTPGRLMDFSGLVVYEDQDRELHEERVYLHDVPDPDDPATAGCLLALLGNERWRLHIDDVGEWSFWVNGPPETHGTGHLIHVGESLGRACIAAAAALGRWPGGEA